MKIPNKLEVQQVAFNHLSDIDFRDIMILNKKMHCKTILFLVIDAKLTSDNLLRFRKNLLERICKLTMTSDYKIRDEKQ